MNLKEWTVRFAEHRHKILETRDSCILCSFKNNKLFYQISEPLSIYKGELPAVLVCLNNKINLDYLVRNWKEFLVPNLRVMFVNPLLNENWSIVPCIHNKVSDPATLKLGLKSIFESVPEVK